MNTFGKSQTEQSYGVGSDSQNQNHTFGLENNNSTQWGLNNTPLAQNNNNNTLSGNLFENNNLFNQNQSVWNKNQYQTPTPWAKQSASFGNNLSTQTKPVYENPNPQGYSAGNIALSALEGFGEGIENGSLALFNAGTGGLYDLASYTFMDDDYAKRQNKMQRQAEDVGLGVANKLANYAIDAGGTSKILKSLGIIK